MGFENADTFPYPDSSKRLTKYTYFNELLQSNHFSAFGIQAQEDFTRQYNRLRYVVSNFAGLVAKVSADMLFGEEPQIIVRNNQEWVDSFYHYNRMRTMLYESALSNAALGDSGFKIYVADGDVRVTKFDPSMYFPHLDGRNLNKKPEVEELAWSEKFDEEAYLIREIYGSGYVNTQIYKLIGSGSSQVRNHIGAMVDVENFNASYGTNFQQYQETNIERNLIVHVPNYREQDYFGVSDFRDIKNLQFALNNRITKIDNILDKHSDPILAVPEGVINEEGEVRKEAFHMIEVGPDGKPPEYIVWNANLEAAFKQIDKLVELMFMMSETSPDVLGMGQGKAESGRALKMRLIRTLAKRQRKILYYDQAIKEVLETAQELAIANGFTVHGERPEQREAVTPEIQWPDGMVNDPVELAKVEGMRIKDGTRSPKKSIMKQDGISQEQAEAQLEEIHKSRSNFTSMVDEFNKNAGREGE